MKPTKEQIEEKIVEIGCEMIPNDTYWMFRELPKKCMRKITDWVLSLDQEKEFLEEKKTKCTKPNCNCMQEYADATGQDVEQLKAYACQAFGYCRKIMKLEGENRLGQQEKKEEVWTVKTEYSGFAKMVSIRSGKIDLLVSSYPTMKLNDEIKEAQSICDRLNTSEEVEKLRERVDKLNEALGDVLANVDQYGDIHSKLRKQIEELLKQSKA